MIESTVSDLLLRSCTAIVVSVILDCDRWGGEEIFCLLVVAANYPSSPELKEA
jgi:hypothetical protein